MKLGKKTKIRLTIWTIALLASVSLFASSFFAYLSNNSKNKLNTEELQSKYNEKLEEEEELKSEIEKLKDPEYMARYTREKYLYSADNEIIIKMED